VPDLYAPEKTSLRLASAAPAARQTRTGRSPARENTSATRADAPTSRTAIVLPIARRGAGIGGIAFGHFEGVPSAQERRCSGHDPSLLYCDRRARRCYNGNFTPGAYTIVLSGGSGLGVIELYDVTLQSSNASLNSKLAAFSTRGYVQDGSGAMIMGFILSATRQAIVRVTSLSTLPPL